MPAADVSSRRRAIYAALALLSLFSVTLILVRYVYAQEPLFGGLIWNLVLAWIPFGLSIVIYDRSRAGSSPLSLLPFAGLWLLFLPNAPYILTDFKHLVPSPNVPLWVDVVVIAAPAWTGMLLGFLSIYLVQSVVRHLAGPLVAWARRSPRSRSPASGSIWAASCAGTAGTCSPIRGCSRSSTASSSTRVRLR